MFGRMAQEPLSKAESMSERTVWNDVMVRDYHRVEASTHGGTHLMVYRDTGPIPFVPIHERVGIAVGKYQIPVFRDNGVVWAHQVLIRRAWINQCYLEEACSRLSFRCQEAPWLDSLWNRRGARSRAWTRWVGHFEKKKCFASKCRREGRNTNETKVVVWVKVVQSKFKVEPS